MGLLSAIIGVFRRGSRGFSEYELRVLEAIARELRPDVAARLQYRIESINLVQRLDGGREVNAFSMSGGHATTNEPGRLDRLPGEHKLAYVEVSGAPGTANTCVVWLVDGHLFSLEFDEPTEHADESAIEAIKAEVLIPALHSV